MTFVCALYKYIIIIITYSAVRVVKWAGATMILSNLFEVKFILFWYFTVLLFESFVPLFCLTVTTKIFSSQRLNLCLDELAGCLARRVASLNGPALQPVWQPGQVTITVEGICQQIPEGFDEKETHGESNLLKTHYLYHTNNLKEKVQKKRVNLRLVFDPL